MGPLVSIVIPTLSTRSRVFDLAMNCVQSQRYRNVEVRVVLDARPTGRARNLVNSKCSGDIIVHFDDDDWSSPDRIEKQVLALTESDASVCGTSSYYSCDPRSGESVETDETGGPWCGSLAYLRRTWQAHPFDDALEGECNSFRAAYSKSTFDMKDRGLVVHMRHGQNTVGPGAEIYGANRERATIEVGRMVRLAPYRSALQ